MASPQRLHSTAAERNCTPITDVLQRVLAYKPSGGNLLEISSGTGQHAAHFGKSFPNWRIQPSDCDTRYMSSIPAWTSTISNVADPIQLDVTVSEIRHPPRSYDVLFNANMIHISPWPATTIGLMRVACHLLREDGVLVMYGPYVVDGETAESNREFSRSLQNRDASWGVRELRQVERIARNHGLHLREMVKMPANNLCVIYDKREM